MGKQEKPINPWWAYISHIAMWFLSGGLLVMAMSAIESQEWILVGLGFVGSAFLAWAAQGVARQLGYVKAIHVAYMEDERKRRSKADAEHKVD